MNNIKVIAIGVVLATLSGCFSDEGNYDYDAPLVISVEGIENSYAVSPTGDRLTISPVITPADRTYDCFWTVTSASATWGDKVDTISRQQNLDYPVNLDMGNYKLRFNAKDRQTGVFSYTEYDLSVTTDMAAGWWLLKTVDGETDIDFFSTEKDKHDVLMSANEHEVHVHLVWRRGAVLEVVDALRGAADAAQRIVGAVEEHRQRAGTVVLRGNVVAAECLDDKLVVDTVLGMVHRVDVAIDIDVGV